MAPPAHFLWVLGPSQGKLGRWMGVCSQSDWERLAHRMTEEGWDWRCGIWEESIGVRAPGPGDRGVMGEQWRGQCW